jgi:hypothetical protein
LSGWPHNKDNDALPLSREFGLLLRRLDINGRKRLGVL